MINWETKFKMDDIPPNEQDELTHINLKVGKENEKCKKLLG